MKKSKAVYVATAASVAALYVVLTLVSSMFGLSSGVIQVRISEALTILPAFTPAAIPGLFIGCILSNLLSGGLFLDVVFGSLATLIGTVGTYLLRKRKWLVSLPPIISNVIVVPLVLRYVYGAPDAYLFMVGTVGAGEIIFCGILGMILYFAVDKYKVFKK